MKDRKFKIGQLFNYKRWKVFKEYHDPGFFIFGGVPYFLLENNTHLPPWINRHQVIVFKNKKLYLIPNSDIMQEPVMNLSPEFYNRMRFPEFKKWVLTKDLNTYEYKTNKVFMLLLTFTLKLTIKYKSSITKRP